MNCMCIQIVLASMGIATRVVQECVCVSIYLSGGFSSTIYLKHAHKQDTISLYELFLSLILCLTPVMQGMLMANAYHRLVSPISWRLIKVLHTCLKFKNTSKQRFELSILYSRVVLHVCKHYYNDHCLCRA